MVLPLFIIEDEHLFKHGGMAGNVFYVIKSSKEQKERKKMKNEKKGRKEKKKKRRIKCSLVLFGFINFPSYFEELFHTQIFQPCAIR